MKKIIAFTLAFSLMAPFSCGKNKDSSSEPDGDTQQDMLTETELKVALIDGGTGKLEPSLAEFDTANKDITLNITHYENTDTNYSEAFNQLSREMLSGESPDVIIAPCEGTVNLQKSGYLADLTPFINSSDTLNITDLLPNVREAVECNGAIPYLFPCFNYTTYTASADYISGDNENWSFDRAMAFYESLEDKKNFPQSADMWHYFLRKAGYNAIDFEKSSCDFDGDFKKTLDFLLQFPIDLKNDIDYKSEGTDYMNSLNITGINGINKFAASDIYGRFNGAPMTYVGYPSADNNGAYVNIPHLWAIPEYSVNKDAAWRLLENYFRQSEQKKMSIEYVSGVPVTESGLQALAYDTPSVIGMSVRGNLAQWLGGEESMQISDEAVEKLLDYSRNVKIDLNYGDELDSMISNEWAEVMRGNISSDECVQNLNNKVGLYLSERS